VSGLVASLPAVTLVAPILFSMIVRHAAEEPA